MILKLLLICAIIVLHETVNRMNIDIISTIAIALYFIAAIKIGISSYLHYDDENGENHMGLSRHLIHIGLLLGLTAAGTHALVLYHKILVIQGFNFGIFTAASTVAWLVALIVILSSLRNPLINLNVLVLPLAGASIMMEWFFPNSRILPDTIPLGLRVHILLSILAYSFISLAAILAVTLSIQVHFLHNHKPLKVMHTLPPMQTLEDLMFRFIGIGFFCLSLSLMSGFMFLEDIFAQHLVHKTVLSLLAWLLFAILLLGRVFYAWRGRKAIRYTLFGFSTLLLAYFGSKTVLEIILKRV